MYCTDMVWYGMVRYDMVWYWWYGIGEAWHGMVWWYGSGMTWHGEVHIHVQQSAEREGMILSRM